MISIFIHRDGQNVGPLSLTEFHRQLSSEEIKPSELAWYEGLENWESASEVVANLKVSALPTQPPKLEVNNPNEISSSYAEQFRRAHLSHEASIRSLGVLYYISSGCMILIAIAAMITLCAHPPQKYPPSTYLLQLIVCGLLGPYLFWMAGKLRRLSRKSIIPITIISSIGLLGIPFGTIINTYILYLIHSEKGKIVFSRQYREVIKSTPSIKYQTNVFVRILIWLFVGTVSAFLMYAGLSGFQKRSMQQRSPITNGIANLSSNTWAQTPELLQGGSLPYKITIPGDWIVQRQVAPFDLSAHHNSLYIGVIAEEGYFADTDTLALQAQERLTRIGTDMEWGLSSTIELHGHSWKQFSVKGNVNHMKIAYQFYVYGGNEGSYQIVGWTAQNLSDRDFPKIDQIFKTFQFPTPQDPPTNSTGSTPSDNRQEKR